MRTSFFWGGCNWVALPLNLFFWLCYRQHLLLNKFQSKLASTKSGCTPTRRAKLIHKHALRLCTNSEVCASSLTPTRRTSLKSFDFCGFLTSAEQDTSTSVDPPSNLWQASPWHLSDHCGVITAAPNVSTPTPPPLSLAQALGSGNILQNRAGLSAPIQEKNVHFKGTRHPNPAVRCGKTWHCQDRGNGVESMFVSHCITSIQHLTLTSKSGIFMHTSFLTFSP